MFDVLLHALAAAAASFITVPMAVRLLAHLQVMDRPNERSSHNRPVPRGGGIGLLSPWLAGMIILALGGTLPGGGFPAALTLGVIGLAVVGFVDDMKTLPPLPRLLIEGLLVAACLKLGDVTIQRLGAPGLGSLELGVAGPVVTWLFVVGFTNMFNFMDGINGLAGFQTLLGAGGLAVLAALGGDPLLALPMALLAGGSVGFLRSNFPRAAVFLGDVGSLPIGFALAMGVVRMHDHGDLPLWIPVLTIWPFLFDATYTLVNRVLKGRNPFRAHRSHVYQRLVVSGLAQPLVTGIYTVTMLLSLAVLFLALHDRRVGGLLFWVLACLTLAGTVLTASRIRASRTVGTQ